MKSDDDDDDDDVVGESGGLNLGGPGFSVSSFEPDQRPAPRFRDQILRIVHSGEDIVKDLARPCAPGYATGFEVLLAAVGSHPANKRIMFSDDQIGMLLARLPLGAFDGWRRDEETLYVPDLDKEHGYTTFDYKNSGGELVSRAFTTTHCPRVLGWVGAYDTLWEKFCLTLAQMGLYIEADGYKQTGFDTKRDVLKTGNTFGAFFEQMWGYIPTIHEDPHGWWAYADGPIYDFNKHAFISRGGEGLARSGVYRCVVNNGCKAIPPGYSEDDIIGKSHAECESMWPELQQIPYPAGMGRKWNAQEYVRALLRTIACDDEHADYLLTAAGAALCGKPFSQMMALCGMLGGGKGTYMELLHYMLSGKASGGGYSVQFQSSAFASLALDDGKFTTGLQRARGKWLIDFDDLGILDSSKFPASAVLGMLKKDGVFMVHNKGVDAYEMPISGVMMLSYNKRSAGLEKKWAGHGVVRRLVEVVCGPIDGRKHGPDSELPVCFRGNNLNQAIWPDRPSRAAAAHRADIIRALVVLAEDRRSALLGLLGSSGADADAGADAVLEAEGSAAEGPGLKLAKDGYNLFAASSHAQNMVLSTDDIDGALRDEIVLILDGLFGVRVREGGAPAPAVREGGGAGVREGGGAWFDLISVVECVRDMLRMKGVRGAGAVSVEAMESILRDRGCEPLGSKEKSEKKNGYVPGSGIVYVQHGPVNGVRPPTLKYDLWKCAEDEIFDAGFAGLGWRAAAQFKLDRNAKCGQGVGGLGMRAEENSGYAEDRMLAYELFKLLG